MRAHAGIAESGVRSGRPQQHGQPPAPARRSRQGARSPHPGDSPRLACQRSKPNEARSLNTLGLTYYALGEYRKALDYHREALAIRRQLADRAAEAASLDGAGRALHRLGDDGEALNALREALTIRQAIREQYGEADTLEHLALLERDRNNLSDALRHVETAVDLEETLRARITSPELRASYVAATHDKYELFIDVRQRLHLAEPTGGHAAAALKISERARARVLLESLVDARVDLRQGIEPALLERERLLQRQLNEAATQLSRSLARSQGKDQSAAAEKVERLTADYQHLQAQIRQQSPRYAALTQPQPLDAAAIQQSVVDDDTVLLEFALGEERSWLWAVTPRTLTSVELPARREIERAARSLYQGLTARQKQPGENSAGYATRVAAADAALEDQARTVSRMLLGGIARQLSTEWRRKRLVIAAAGVLEYLPFTVLRAPDQTLLVAQHEIVTIPSASVLATLRRDTVNRTARAATARDSRGSGVRGGRSAAGGAAFCNPSINRGRRRIACGERHRRAVCTQRPVASALLPRRSECDRLAHWRVRQP